MKLNLGCGNQTPQGWTNVDYALGARLMKLPMFRAINSRLKLFGLDWDPGIYVHDLTRRLPWRDSSVDVIYSSHTLEHFSVEEGRRFLSECRRVLCENGIIRLVVPDLRHYIGEYTEGRTKAYHFIEQLGVLHDNRKNTPKSIFSAFCSFPHKCMYDESALIDVLNQVGFDVSPKAVFDSEIEGIRLIESMDRAENAVIVEGHK